MQLTCPACSCRASIEAFLTDEAARLAVVTALQLPAALADPILRYLALFRPPRRALAWDRAGRLLEQLLQAIQSGYVERKGKRYRASVETWALALEEVLDGRERLRLPLKTHGYLFEVVAGLSNQVAAAVEERREEHRRTGRNRPPQAVEVRRADPVRAHELMARTKAALRGSSE